MSQTFLEDIPEFLEIQRSSFLRILDNGLIQALEKINPISPTTQCDYGLLFYPKEYVLVLPETTITEAFLQGKTYGCKIYVPAIVYETEKKTSPVLKKKSGVKMSKTQGKGSSGLTSFGLAKKTMSDKDNSGFLGFDNQKSKIDSTSKKQQNQGFTESFINEKKYSISRTEEQKLPVKGDYQKNQAFWGQLDQRLIPMGLGSNISTFVELNPVPSTKGSAHGLDRSRNLWSRNKNLKPIKGSGSFIKTFNKQAWIGPFGPTPLHLLPKEGPNTLARKAQKPLIFPTSKEKVVNTNFSGPKNLELVTKVETHRKGGQRMKLQLEQNFDFFSKENTKNPTVKKESAFDSLRDTPLQFASRAFKPTLYGPASKSWTRVARVQNDLTKKILLDFIKKKASFSENPTIFNGNVIFKKKYLQYSESFLKNMCNFKPNLQSFLRKTIKTPKVTEKALSLLFFSQKWKEKGRILIKKNVSSRLSGISQEKEQSLPYSTNLVNNPQNFSRVKENPQFAKKPNTLMSKSWPIFCKTSWTRTTLHSYGRPFKTSENDSLGNPLDSTKGGRKVKSGMQKRVDGNITKIATGKKNHENKDHLCIDQTSKAIHLTPSSNFWFKILSFLGSSWSGSYSKGSLESSKDLLNGKIKLESIRGKQKNTKGLIFSSNPRFFDFGIRPITTRSVFQYKNPVLQNKRVHFRSHSWSTVKDTILESQGLQNNVAFTKLPKTIEQGKEKILRRKTKPLSFLSVYSKEIYMRLALPCGGFDSLNKIKEVKLTTLTQSIQTVKGGKEGFLGSKNINFKGIHKINSKVKVLPFGTKGKVFDLRTKGFNQKSKPFGLVLRSNFFSSRFNNFELLKEKSKTFEKEIIQNTTNLTNTSKKKTLTLKVLGQNQKEVQSKKLRSGQKAVIQPPKMRVWSSSFVTESTGIVFSQNFEQIKDQNSPFDCSLSSKAFGFQSIAIEQSSNLNPIQIKAKPLSKKEWVCIGLLPLMTPRGHFIINGSHRIVVSQMSRAPGLYYQTGEKLQATIVPSKGAWLRMSVKVNDNGEIKIWVRITPQRKMPYKIFLETYKYLEKLKDPQKDGTTKSKFLNLTYKNINSKIKHFDKHYAIGVISGQINRTLLNMSSYTLGNLGRKRLNERLGIREKKGYITSKDISLIKDNLLKFLDQDNSTSLDDDIDHLENRRVRTCGELLQTEIEVGMTRLKKAIAKQLDDYLNKNASTFSVKQKQTTDNFITNQTLRSKTLPNLLKTKNLNEKNKDFAFVWEKGLNLGYDLGLDPGHDLGQEALTRNKKRENWPQKVGINLTLLYSQKSKNKKKNFFDIKTVKPGAQELPLADRANLRFGTFQNTKGEKKVNQNQKKNLNTLWSPSKIVGTKAFAGALREFFGSNPLSQYMDQTNPLAEITHKRRLSSLGPGGVDRASAGIAIRGIHPSHYGRICPIETPEGKNAGLVNSMTMWARINQEGFLETPYIKVKSGSIMSHKKNLSPEWFFIPTKKESRGVETISSTNFSQTVSTSLPKADQNFGIFETLMQNSYARKTKALKIVALDLKIESSFLPNIPLPTRDESERSFGRHKRNVIDFCGVSPTQNISVATSLIPFLEHDDATRALMGSNMQRQAVPLLKAQGPLVRTGLEGKVVGESGHAVQATSSGLISIVTRGFISIDTFIENHKTTSPLLHTRLNKQKNFYLGWIHSDSNSYSKVLNLGSLNQLFIFLVQHCQDKAFTFPQRAWQGFSSNLKSLTSELVEKNDPQSLVANQKEIFYNYNCNRLLVSQKLCTIVKGNFVKKNILLAQTVKKINQKLLFQKKKDLGLHILSPNAIEQEFSLIPKNYWRKSLKISRERKTQTLQGYTRSNQATICVQRPAVKEGRWIQKGDLLGDCSASRNGVLALGQNIVVAYLPMEGFNFEDAIVVSDRLVREELYTSIHIQRVEFDMDALVKKHIPPKIKVKKQKSAYKTIQQDWITWHNPHLLKSEKENLSSLGIIKVGSWVGPGDVLVSKVFPVERKIAPSRHLLLAVFQEKKTKTLDTDDTSLRVPKGIHGRVINVKIVGNGTIVPPNSMFSSHSSKVLTNKNLIPSISSRVKKRPLLSQSGTGISFLSSAKTKTPSLVKSTELHSQDFSKDLLFDNVMTLPQILVKQDFSSRNLVGLSKAKRFMSFAKERKRKPLQNKSLLKVPFREAFLAEQSSVKEKSNNAEKWYWLTKSQTYENVTNLATAVRPKTISFRLGFCGPKKPWRDFSGLTFLDPLISLPSFSDNAGIAKVRPPSLETLGLRRLKGLTKIQTKDFDLKGQDHEDGVYKNLILSRISQKPKLSVPQSLSHSMSSNLISKKEAEGLDSFGQKLTHFEIENGMKEPKSETNSNLNIKHFGSTKDIPFLIKNSNKGEERKNSQIEWAQRWINLQTSPKSCGYPQSVGFLPTLGSLSILSVQKVNQSKEPLKFVTQTEKISSRFLSFKESLGVKIVKDSRWAKESKQQDLSNLTSSTSVKFSTSKESEKIAFKLRSSKPFSQAQELQISRVNSFDGTKDRNLKDIALQKLETSNTLITHSPQNSSTFSEKKMDILWKQNSLDMRSKNDMTFPSQTQRTRDEMNRANYQNKNVYSSSRPLGNHSASLQLKELEIEKIKIEGEYKIVQIRVYIAERKKLQVGDKMSGRHGNKGIVSTILPREDMPYLPDGTPVDMVLNPLGIPSRMNVGQVFECLLGLAASVCGETIGHTPFDEMYGPEASRSLVYLFLYVARLRARTDWLFQPNFPGKTIVFDGRTGTPFEQWVTVGRAYMLKLIHMVDEKIHARSIGPRSLVTQQPVKGRARGGGQRLGEMELWAFEGFGAAYTLQEILTLKSDDIRGRENVENSIIFATTARAHIPETFRMMLFELRCLCLNVELNKNS